jgi:GntR family transcriptional regulator of gluconate operon
VDALESFEPEVAPRRALWETIVEPMRRAIILGKLPPGLHLEEPALARKFGVSRIPVREAIVRLGHEGLVRVEPWRGAFIVGVTEDDISDLYEFRLLVESRAIRRAVSRFDELSAAELAALVDQMDEAVGRGQRHLMVEPDVEFHRAVVAASGSRQLVTAWDRIAGMVSTMLGITNTSYRYPADAVGGHRELVDALARHDAESAEQSLKLHLANGEQVMREAMAAARSTPAALPALQVGST